jgi:hypothetical protein
MTITLLLILFALAALVFFVLRGLRTDPGSGPE